MTTDACAAEHPVDVDSPQAERRPEAHLGSDRIEVRAHRVKCFSIGRGVQIAQVQPELLTAARADDQGLSEGADGHGRQAVVEPLTRGGNAFAIEILHLRDVADVRRPVGGAGRQRSWVARAEAIADRLQADRVAHSGVPVSGPGVSSVCSTTSIVTVIRSWPIRPRAKALGMPTASPSDKSARCGRRPPRAAPMLELRHPQRGP